VPHIATSSCTRRRLQWRCATYSNCQLHATACCVARNSRLQQHTHGVQCLVGTTKALQCLLRLSTARAECSRYQHRPCTYKCKRTHYASLFLQRHMHRPRPVAMLRPSALHWQQPMRLQHSSACAPAHPHQAAPRQHLHPPQHQHRHHHLGLRLRLPLGPLQCPRQRPRLRLHQRLLQHQALALCLGEAGTSEQWPVGVVAKRAFELLQPYC
jgi:hypothetical protein